MRRGVVAPTLGIMICLAVVVLTAYGNNRTFGSFTQDDTWTVIEYPEGQEVAVELKPASSMPEAKGTARVTRTETETTINLDVSGVTGESAHQVYIVDSLGNATLLGTLAVTDGAGSLSAKTALSKFMIVVSPEADLTMIGSETKVALRSTVPSGFAVIPREKNAEPTTAEPTTTDPSPASTEMATSATEPTRSAPEYEVPLLGISSLKRNANTTMKANFASGFASARAVVTVKPQKNGPTQINMRFTKLKETPEGTQYLLWEVGPDNSYTLLGHLSQTPNKREMMINAESTLPDFGLLITFENAEATTPMGSVVATIAK